MNEQTIFLIFLVSALAVTLGLYFLKAKKQMQYKGDERWKLIQLNANNAANISNTVLIVLIVVLPLLIDSQTTFTLQRVVTYLRRPRQFRILRKAGPEDSQRYSYRHRRRHTPRRMGQHTLRRRGQPIPVQRTHTKRHA